MCDDAAADRTWDDKGLHKTNICVVDLEAQELEHFPEWREILRVALEQVGWSEAAVKDLWIVLGDTNVTHIRHEDELTLIFDKFSVFQEGVLQNICTVKERVDKMGVSTLKVFTDQGSSHLEALVVQISDLDKYRISDHLHINLSESRLNAGADELAIVEEIFRSPEYLKVHIVAFQGESSNCRGFVCVYKILKRIHQRINGEETVDEFMK